MQRAWSFNGADEVIRPKIVSLLSLSLDDLYALPPTRLCRIMDKAGSNKADREAHPYTVFYDALFGDLDAQRVLEIGIGSQDESADYHMASHNIPGGSLRGWRSYFPNASICAGDYDWKILIQEPRIRSEFFCQRDEGSVFLFLQEFAGEPFDLIVDDAVHEATANVRFFKHAFPMLRPGGWYIIEDLQRSPKEFGAHLAFAESTGHPTMVIDFTRGETPINACFTIIKKCNP